MGIHMGTETPFHRDITLSIVERTFEDTHTHCNTHPRNSRVEAVADTSSSRSSIELLAVLGAKKKRINSDFYGNKKRKWEGSWYFGLSLLFLIFRILAIPPKPLMLYRPVGSRRFTTMRSFGCWPTTWAKPPWTTSPLSSFMGDCEITPRATRLGATISQKFWIPILTTVWVFFLSFNMLLID